MSHFTKSTLGNSPLGAEARDSVPYRLDESDGHARGIKDETAIGSGLD